MSHSQFKKYNILQELEQAIKKKTQEKYRTKSKPKYPPSAIRPEVKPVKSPQVDRNPLPKSIQINKTANSTQFKVKKHQNKKFDKLVSLINYTITSADKALKYINLSTNFQAQFTYKLYHSDRQNLMNELNSININDFSTTSSYQVQQKVFNSSSGLNIEAVGLKNQVERLRKDNMLMENELKKYRIQESDQRSPKKSDYQRFSAPQRQTNQLLQRKIQVKDNQFLRVSSILKKICLLQEVHDYLESVQKQTKLRILLASLDSQGYSGSRTQRGDVQTSLFQTEKKITTLERDIIAKVSSVGQKSDQIEDTTIQIQKIRQVINRKILPVISETTTQQIAFDSYSDIITMYISIINKRQKEILSTQQKLERELIQTNQKLQDFITSKRTAAVPQTRNDTRAINELKKENQLMKINLTEIYDQIKDILEDGNVIGDGEHTFQDLIKAINQLLESNRILNKKLSQVGKSLASEQKQTEQKDKNNTINKGLEEQNKSLTNTIKIMENERKEIEEFIGIMQKKHKELSQQLAESKELSQKVNKIQLQLQTKTQQVKQHLNTIGILEQTGNKNAEKIKKIDKLELENTDLKGKLNKTKQETVQLANHVRYLEQQVRSLAENQASDETDRYLELIERLEGQNRDLKNENQQLGEQLNEMARISEEHQHKGKQIKELRDVLMEYQMKEQNINGELERLIRDNEEYKRQRQVSQAQLKVKNAAEQMYSSKIKELTNEINSRQEIIKERDQQYHQMMANSQQQVGRLTEIVCERQQQIKNIQSQLITRKNQGIDEIQVGLRINKKQLEIKERYDIIMKEKNQELQQIHIQYEQLHQQNTKILIQIQQKTKQVNDLTNQLQDKYQQLQNLQMELGKKDQEISAHKGMVEFMAGKQTESDEKLEDLTNLVYELQQLNDKVNQLEQERSQLHQKIDSDTQQIAKLSESIQKRDVSIQQISAALAVQKQGRTTINQEELNMLRQQIKIREHETDLLFKQSQQYKETVASLEKEREQLNAGLSKTLVLNKQLEVACIERDEEFNTIIDQLKQDLAIAQEKNLNLQNQIKEVNLQLLAKLSGNQQEIDNLTQEINQKFLSEFAQLQNSQKHEISQQKHHYEGQLSELKSAHQDLLSRIEAAHGQQIMQLNKQVEQKIVQIRQDYQRKIEQISQQHETSQANEQNVGQMRDKISQLKKQIIIMNTERQKMKEKVTLDDNYHDKELRRLNCLLSVKEGIVLDLEHEKQILTLDLQKNSRLLEQKTSELERVQNKFDELQSQQDQEKELYNQQLTSNIQRLEVQLRNAKSETETIKKSFNEQISSLTHQILEIGQNLKTLQKSSSLQKIELQKHLKVKDEQLQGERKLVNDLKDELGQKQTERKTLEGKLKVEEQIANQLQQNAEQYEEKIKEMMQEIASLKDNLENIETINNHQNQSDHLKDQITQRQIQLQQLKQEISAKDLQILDLQSDIGNMENSYQINVSELETQIQNNKEQLTTMSQQAINAHSELEKVQGQLYYRKTEYSELQAKYQQVQKVIQEHEKEVMRLEEQAQQERQKLQNIIQGLQKQLCNVRSEHQNAQVRLKELSTVSQEKDQKLNRINQSVSKLEQKLRQQQERTVRQQASSNNALIAEQEQQIQDLLDQLRNKDLQIKQLTDQNEAAANETQENANLYEQKEQQLIETYNKEVEYLKESLTQKEQQINTLEEETRKLKIQNEQLTEELRKRQLEQKDIQSDETKMLQDMLQSLSNQVNKLQLEKCDIKIELQSHTHKVQVLEQLLQSKNHKIDLQDQKIDQLKQHVHKLIASSSKLSKQMSSSEQISGQPINESQVAMQMLEEISQLQKVIYDYENNQDDNQNFVTQKGQEMSSKTTKRLNKAKQLDQFAGIEIKMNNPISSVQQNQQEISSHNRKQTQIQKLTQQGQQTYLITDQNEDENDYEDQNESYEAIRKEVQKDIEQITNKMIEQASRQQNDGQDLKQFNEFQPDIGNSMISDQDDNRTDKSHERVEEQIILVEQSAQKTVSSAVKMSEDSSLLRFVQTEVENAHQLSSSRRQLEKQQINLVLEEQDKTYLPLVNESIEDKTLNEPQSFIRKEVENQLQAILEQIIQKVQEEQECPNGKNKSPLKQSNQDLTEQLNRLSSNKKLTQLDAEAYQKVKQIPIALSEQEIRFEIETFTQQMEMTNYSLANSRPIETISYSVHIQRYETNIQLPSQCGVKEVMDLVQQEMQRIGEQVAEKIIAQEGQLYPSQTLHLELKTPIEQSTNTPKKGIQDMQPSTPDAKGEQSHHNKTDSMIRRQVEAELDEIEQQILRKEQYKLQTEAQKKQQVVQLSSPKASNQNNLSDFGDFNDEKMNDSVESQEKHQENFDKGNEENYEEDFEEDSQEGKVSLLRTQNIKTGYDELENNSPLYKQIRPNQSQPEENKDLAFQDGNDLGDFGEFKDQMGDSMVSNEQVDQQKEITHKQHTSQIQNHQKYKQKNSLKGSQENNLQDFGEFKDEMGNSMISNEEQVHPEKSEGSRSSKQPKRIIEKQKSSEQDQQGNNISDFGQFKDQMGNSMISNDQKVQIEQEKHQRQHQVVTKEQQGERELNRQESSGNGFTDFKDQRGDSILSNGEVAQSQLANKNNEGEQFDFNQFSDNLRVSAISKKSELNQQAKQEIELEMKSLTNDKKEENIFEKENDFEDFAQFDGKVGVSMLSNKSDIQFKDQEQIKREVEDQINGIIGNLGLQTLGQSPDNNQDLEEFANFNDQAGDSMISHNSEVDLQTEQRIKTETEPYINTTTKEVSNKMQIKESDIDQFADFNDKMGDSLVSNEEISRKNSQKQSSPKNQSCNFNDFGNMSENNVGDSILSQKNDYFQQFNVDFGEKTSFLNSPIGKNIEDIVKQKKSGNRSHNEVILDEFLKNGSQKLSGSQASEQRHNPKQYTLEKVDFIPTDFADRIQPELSESAFGEGEFEFRLPQKRQLFSEFQRHNITDQLGSINQKLRMSGQSGTHDLPELLDMLSGNTLPRGEDSHRMADLEFDFGSLKKESPNVDLMSQEYFENEQNSQKKQSLSKKQKNYNEKE